MQLNSYEQLADCQRRIYNALWSSTRSDKENALIECANQHKTALIECIFLFIPCTYQDFIVTLQQISMFFHKNALL